MTGDDRARFERVAGYFDPPSDSFDASSRGENERGAASGSTQAWWG